MPTHDDDGFPHSFGPLSLRSAVSHEAWAHGQRHSAWPGVRLRGGKPKQRSLVSCFCVGGAPFRGCSVTLFVCTKQHPPVWGGGVQEPRGSQAALGLNQKPLNHY